MSGKNEKKKYLPGSRLEVKFEEQMRDWMRLLPAPAAEITKLLNQPEKSSKETRKRRKH